MSVREVYGTGDAALTYDYSFTSRRAVTRAAAGGRLRVRVIQFLRSMFLPIGYPNSVTPDYVRFQIWDTLQAVSSYLRGLLCTQALLVGVGVGSSEASATSATLQWIMRDGGGMIGGMLFAWSQSSNFGFNIKQWRLFADVINDIGLTLELLSPLYREYFIWFACAGSICRALCGVSAGATRAALMGHFARTDNVADISAKEGIQETAVTLIGLAMGWYCTSWLDGSQRGTWIVFITLTLFHVYANYQAMICLLLNSLNRQRATLLANHFANQRVANVDAANCKALTPADVARLERIFWRDRGPLKVKFASPFHRVFPSFAAFRASIPNVRVAGRYILSCTPKRQLHIVLHTSATVDDQLCSVLHARLVNAQIVAQRVVVTDIKAVNEIVQTTWRTIDHDYQAWRTALVATGWKVNQVGIGSDLWRAQWDTAASITSDAGDDSDKQD